MKILHLNAGNETGGGMVHILSLLKELIKEEDQFLLGVFEKGLLQEKAKKLGVNTVLFEQNSRYDFRILSRIRKFINEEKIDIIHTHGARANLYGYFLRMFTNVTWMTTIHSDPRNDFLGRGLSGKAFTKLNLMILKKPDHFFAISKKFTEMVRGYGVDDKKITTIFNGIDFTLKDRKKEISRKDLKLSQEDFVILMVARFDPVKQHQVAIEAVEQFIKEQHHKETKLLLVGDGPTRIEIERLVNQRGLENHIKFLLYRNDVDSLYSLADVTLLTSASESFPLVLLESSREKTPVITTDVGGVRDMIPDSSYSLVLNSSEVIGITGALEHIFQLKQNNKIAEMGSRFYQYTSLHFSVQSFAKSIYDVYKI